MSTQIKLIIPLLEEDLTKEDFTQESGFVGAYIYDKNEPSLLSHIFLMYDSENRDYKKAKTIEKLNKLKSLYARRLIRVNGHFYVLYTLSMIGKKLKDLLKGIPSFEEADITKTLGFWDLKEDDVNRILLGIDPLLRIDNTSVPEEDYLIPDITTESGYKESLAIRNDDQAFSLLWDIIEAIKRTFY